MNRWDLPLIVGAAFLAGSVLRGNDLKTSVGNGFKGIGYAYAASLLIGIYMAKKTAS